MTIQLTTFLSMNGRAAEAISFYEDYLGAKVLFMKNYVELKAMDPTFNYLEEEANYIAHSVLEIDGGMLMVADEIMSENKEEVIGTNFSICITGDVNEIKIMYAKLLEHSDVKIVIPLEPNIFGHAYGIIEDPFGITIQLVNEKQAKK